MNFAVAKLDNTINSCILKAIYKHGTLIKTKINTSGSRPHSLSCQKFQKQKERFAQN